MTMREEVALDGEESQRLFSCSAQILCLRSELALSVAEAMARRTRRTPQNVVALNDRWMNGLFCILRASWVCWRADAGTGGRFERGLLWNGGQEATL